MIRLYIYLFDFIEIFQLKYWKEDIIQYLF